MHLFLLEYTTRSVAFVGKGVGRTHIGSTHVGNTNVVFRNELPLVLLSWREDVVHCMQSHAPFNMFC